MKQSIDMKPMRKQLLHDRIADQLRNSIQSGFRPGQRLESESTLAQQAGVSIVTLRNAMLILEREGLIARSPGRGTFVCAPSPLPTAHCPPPTVSQHIAIYCGGEAFSARPSYFHLGTISALRRFFTSHNMVTQVYFNHREIENHLVEGPMVETGDTCPEFTQAIAEQRISAAVFLGGDATSSWGKTLLARNIPVVGNGFDVSVTTDWSTMGSLGARQLVTRGCRRLALIAWAGDARLPLATRTDLVGAFCNEIQRMGLDVNEKWIRHDLPAEELGAGWEDLREIWNASPEKPDGLLVADDIMFADVVQAITELRVNVPEDLKIITHANRGAVYPASFPVDRLELDPVEYGNMTGTLLLQRIRGEMPAEPIVTLHHRLVEADARESSNPVATPACAKLTETM